MENLRGTVANAHDPIDGPGLAIMEAKVAASMEDVLGALGIDWISDPNTQGTPRRWAKMLCREVLAGRFGERPKITTFPNTRKVDEVIVVGPIGVRSMCSHHFVPILGQCWIGVIPGDKLLGLSKYSRLTRWIMARPQIQEEAAMQLADEIEALLEPLAIGVVVKAQHLCMTWRGVQEQESEMTSSVMRGKFKDSVSARAELMSLIGGKGFK